MTKHRSPHQMCKLTNRHRQSGVIAYLKVPVKLDILRMISVSMIVVKTTRVRIAIVSWRKQAIWKKKRREYYIGVNWR